MNNQHNQNEVIDRPMKSKKVNKQRTVGEQKWVNNTILSRHHFSFKIKDHFEGGKLHEIEKTIYVSSSKITSAKVKRATQDLMMRFEVINADIIVVNVLRIEEGMENILNDLHSHNWWSIEPSSQWKTYGLMRSGKIIEPEIMMNIINRSTGIYFTFYSQLLNSNHRGMVLSHPDIEFMMELGEKF